MKVFVTGATGFIGSALVPELLNAGHEVIGLARSGDGVQRLRSQGVQVQHGSLEDLSSLRLGASQAEAVIHLAYNPDISQLEENSRKEAEAIQAFGDELAGSKRPLLLTSVAAMGSPAPGQVALENFYSPDTPNPRKATEIAGRRRWSAA